MTSQASIRRFTEPSCGFCDAMLFESSVIATIHISLDGKVRHANNAMLKLLSAGSNTDLEGTDFKRELVLSDSAWKYWQQALVSGEVVSDVEITLRSRDGRDVCLRGDIAPLVDHREGAYLCGVFADTTATKQLQSALQRAAHMDAVGSLTSGIAHDFNNLLTVLVGNLYLVAEGVRDDPPLFEQAKRARDAAKRGAALTRQLLNFAQSEHIDVGPLDLGTVLGNLEPLLRRTTGSKISLQTKVDPQVGLVDARAAQLESVIVNLALNGKDAIEGQGTILIECANCFLDQLESVRYGLAAGEYIRISVTDDGAGIPEALQKTVFEPFFSTKPHGRGTGLGLSMVRWFAEQAGGAVDLVSRPGHGTTVSLVLPESRRREVDVEKTMPLSTLPTGEERVVILVESEELRSTVEQILKVLGYTVALADGPRQMLDIGSSMSADLLMVDRAALVDVGVEEFVQKVHELGTSVKVIIVGNSKSVSPGQHAAFPELIKPFSLFELATLCRQTLDGDAND